MNENTRLFVEALRSGHYKQAQEVLVKIGGTGADGEFYDEATAYCCLGLGSKLAGCEVDPQRGVRFTRSEPHYGEDEIWYDTLPGRELFDWLGIDVKENNQVNTGDRLWDGVQGRDIVLDVAFDTIDFQHFDTGKIDKTAAMKITLANLNDWGCTFDQIADMIERFGFKGAMVNA